MPAESGGIRMQASPQGSWLTARCSWVPWHSPHLPSGSCSKTLEAHPCAGPTAGCGELQSGAGLQRHSRAALCWA